MKKYVGLKLIQGVGYRIQETKWDRQIGDKMDIEGRKWEVVAVGDRYKCLGVVNAEIDAINEVTRAKNAEIRKQMKNRPATDFEKTVSDILNRILSY